MLNEAVRSIHKNMPHIKKGDIKDLLRHFRSFLIKKVYEGKNFRFNGVFTVHFEEKKEFTRKDALTGEDALVIRGGIITRIRIAEELKFAAKQNDRRNTL